MAVDLQAKCVAQHADAPLLGCLGNDRHLVARCACGQASACDPVQWVSEGLGDQPLWRFAERLRCICGAREARLEIAAGPYAPARRPGVYVFR